MTALEQVIRDLRDRGGHQVDQWEVPYPRRRVMIFALGPFSVLIVIHPDRSPPPFEVYLSLGDVDSVAEIHAALGRVAGPLPRALKPPRDELARPGSHEW